MFNTSREPAAYAEAVRLAIAALVGVGWITIDDATINAIVTAVGALASIALTAAVRANVTPVVTVPPANNTLPEE
jgi:hypothetical protein